MRLTAGAERLWHTTNVTQPFSVGADNEPRWNCQYLRHRVEEALQPSGTGRVHTCETQVEQGGHEGLRRREFLRRGALSGLGAALAPLTVLLERPGMATAAPSNGLTRETLNAFIAFLVPGNDVYSQHQGVSTSRPGGVGAGVVDTFVYDLDEFVPASTFGSAGATVPSSGGVAALLNSYAGLVAPAALGPFASAFARLTFGQKAQAFQRIEHDLEGLGNELAFVGGILPGFATFLSFSEAAVFDADRMRLRGRPVGWQLTHYAGPSDGWPEFRGYYGHRRRVRGAGPNATRASH